MFVPYFAGVVCVVSAAMCSGVFLVVFRFSLFVVGWAFVLFCVLAFIVVSAKCLLIFAGVSLVFLCLLSLFAFVIKVFLSVFFVFCFRCYFVLKFIVFNLG